MENDQLTPFVKKGFLPGPNENESSFLRRVDYNLRLSDTLEFEKTPSEISAEGLSLSEELFGVRPLWIPFQFSNYKLPFWVGGCAWIFQETENSPRGAFIQMRNSFLHSAHFLFYRREELIAHEVAHVGRMEFEEPEYEEIFAYHSSPGRFRRFWGPLFSQQWEMMIFMILVVFVFLSDLCAIWWGGWDNYLEIFPLKLLPLGWLGWLAVKLVRKQRRLTRLKSRYPLSFLYCLTDQEINAFDKMDDRQIRLYASRQGCLRWQAIRELWRETFKRNEETETPL